MTCTLNNGNVQMEVVQHQKNLSKWLFIFLSLFLFSTLKAQEFPAEILFMNGKRVKADQIDDTTYVPIQYTFDKNYFKKERINIKAAHKQDLLYTPQFSTHKAQKIPVVLKTAYADRSDVFSITYPSGQETIYYEYDEPRGNFLTTDEMRAYVYGERDARVALSGKAWFYTGLGVGAIGGYALRTSVVSLVIPPVFALSAKIPIIHIKEKYIADKSFQYNRHYALGFERYTRSNNAIQGLKGSAIGTAVGIIVFAIVDNNR